MRPHGPAKRLDSSDAWQHSPVMNATERTKSDASGFAPPGRHMPCAACPRQCPTHAALMSLPQPAPAGGTIYRAHYVLGALTVWTFWTQRAAPANQPGVC